jgi:hypothetical protein
MGIIFDIRINKKAVMKRISFIMAVSLISLLALPEQLYAQDKSREQRERELRIAEEIDAQKKAFAEQRRAKEIMEKALDSADLETESRVREALKHLDHADSRLKGMLGFPNGDFPYFDAKPFVFSPGPEGFNWFSPDNDSERTSWDIFKSVKEDSFSRDFNFVVDLSKTVVMSVNGECREGEIRIKIGMPNGKVYSDIVIDEFGNLNWKKSFRVTEEENTDKAGEWKFQVHAVKASGFFKISVQTY